MSLKNCNSRCQARAKSGKPCQAAATAGGLCFFHANPNKASELGRVGGRSKRPSAAAIVDPLPKLDKVIAVQDAVEQLITDVYAGKLHPRIAAGLAPLLNLQLRALEATDLERRIAKVEKLLAENENGSRGHSLAPPLSLGDLPSHFGPAGGAARHMARRIA